MSEDQIKIIKDLTGEFFNKLLVQADVEVAYDRENKTFNIQVESKDSSILIGYHGETLQAIQLILSLMVFRKLGSWVNLVVNVGNYRQERQEQLKRLALNIAQKVKFSGESQVIPNLSSAERKIIHLVLANHPDVTTDSEGEGRERRLVIKPKKSK